MSLIVGTGWAGMRKRTSTVDWCTDISYGSVAHEGHHIEIYEAHVPAMNEAVRGGTCASVQADLERLITDAQRAYCEFGP
jgi:hypothetical protein